MELLQTCREHAHSHYGELLLAAEKTLSDALFTQADKCTSNEDQRRYFEAIQKLKEHGSAMHHCFQQELGAAFMLFSSGEDNDPVHNQPLDAGNLSLIHREELEDDLAISVIVAKATSRNSESLWKLNQRLAVLRGGKAVNDETNPFGPAKVCAALQKAITELAIDSKVKILIYKQLGTVFIISFGKAIDSLNNLLIEKNILPNLRFSASSRASEQRGTTQQAPDNSRVDTENLAVDTSAESPTSIAHQHELYNAIRSLQSAIGPRTETAGGVSYQGVATDGSGGADSFSAMDYALALSAIQQSAAFLAAAANNKPLAAEKVEQQLIKQLSQKSEQSSHHKMTKDDADTVDLVGMIFRYMLDDPNLHDAVKSLLSHLHTPYLKLALMDKSFLDDSKHNARILLNAMADLGSKWVKDDNDRTVLPKIKTVVETILKGFIDDASMFDRLLEDFSRFRENLEKRARMVEKRNTESQQGLEKLELSKQQAFEEISLRLDKAQIADNIAQLLHKPWSDFLAFNLLRHGDDSLTWESALKVVDGVIWSVRAEAVADNKDDFYRHQSDLEKSVSEGLRTIGYDTEASKNLLKALREAQELAYHSSVMSEVNQQNSKAEKTPVKPSQPDPSTNPAPKIAKSPPVTKPKASPDLSVTEQRIVEKLKEIAFGTWFEFEHTEGMQALKLAWYSGVSSHYMFVDQAGVKQRVENQFELARAMSNGTVRIAKPVKKSFMERALETVLETLKLS